MEFSGILNGPCPKSFHSLGMSVTYKYAQCEMSAWLIENVSKLGDTVPIPKCASIEHSFRVFLWHLAYPVIQAINIPSQLVVDGSHARPGDSSELVIYPTLIKFVFLGKKLIDNFPINMSIEWGGFSIDTFDYQRAYEFLTKGHAAFQEISSAHCSPFAAGPQHATALFLTAGPAVSVENRHRSRRSPLMPQRPHPWEPWPYENDQAAAETCNKALRNWCQVLGGILEKNWKRRWEKTCTFKLGNNRSRVRISNHYGAKNGCKQHLHSNYSPGQFTQSDWQDFQLMGKDGIPIPVLRFSYLNGPGSKQIVSNKGLYGCMPFFRAQLKMILTYTIDQLKSPILHVV